MDILVFTKLCGRYPIDSASIRPHHYHRQPFHMSLMMTTYYEYVKSCAHCDSFLTVTSTISPTSTCTTLTTSNRTFLSHHPLLTLSGPEGCVSERQHHSKIFRIHAFLHLIALAYPPSGVYSHSRPTRDDPIRVLHLNSAEAAALGCFHGDGYTIGQR